MRKALGRYRLARRGGLFGAVAAITVLVASVSAMAVTPASAAVQHTAEHATAGHTAAMPAAAAPHGLTAWRSRHKLRLPDPKPRMHPKPHPAPLGRPGGVPVGDEAITASSDTSGYHVFAAASGDGWRWHALATLQPAGYRDQAWIGQQCLTGDGRYVVAVVAPWGAQNSAAGIAAGGLAYAIDAHTGAVRPLAAGLALTYFDPGCGTGSTAALTRYGSADQSRTQILAVNAATGAVTATPVIANQVTSAVPVGGTLYAAEGRRLVRVLGNGRVSVLAAAAGPVFRLVPNAGNGVDFLAEQGRGANPLTGLFRLAGGHVTRTATGRLAALRLFPGTAGRDMMAGASAVLAPGPRPLTASAGLMRMATAISSAGGMIVPSRTARGAVSRTAADRGGRVTPAAGGAGSTGAAGGALPAAAPPTLALPPAPQSGPAVRRAAAAGRPARQAARPSADPGASTGSFCAVPRNDSAYQVMQPSAQMINWAINLAAQGALPGRADGQFNLHTGAYNPSSDFRLPQPFGAGGAAIPQQIMDGIFAQESNWAQASPHAPPGLAGNPLIADYYGIYSPKNSTGNIDYPLSDCGYGLGQVTSLMRLASPGDAPTAPQQRVAVDYAENAAASAQILANTWSHLGQDGMTAGDNNPQEIENWYFTIWAYNSGINPQESTGNTTGCTPGPSCTDSAGNWGLGWTNNPANPSYDPQRHPFLHFFLPDGTPVQSYSDAATPQGWPYQEKVFGWIENGQYETDGVTQKFTPTFDYTTGTGFFLHLPLSPYVFCTGSNNCSYNQPQPCGYSANGDPLQWHCWWHQPDGNAVCQGTCHSGTWSVAPGTAEPAQPNPFPSVCSPPSDFTDTAIVDDNTAQTNLAGCSTAAANATMQWLPNADPNGNPFGDIDLHQIGSGYGGRTMFTHLEDTSNAIWGGTMRWTPSNLNYDVYDIEVFVPGLAAAGTLTYNVHSADGTILSSATVNQNDYSNQWVPIGVGYLAPGSYVDSTNVVAGGDGSTDVAFDAIAFRPVSSFVSLGDSYSSGLGTGNYDKSTNQTGVNECKTSPDSYARVWAQWANPSVPVVQLACAGAVIKDLTTDSLWSEPPQIPATPLHAAQVFLTIGGNDVGFPSVLSQCINPVTNWQGCESFYTQDNANNLDNTIESLKPTLTDAYQQLKDRVPAAAVTVLTYPKIFQPTTTGSSCLFSSLFRLSAQDIEWLISEANHLDNVIARAVNPFASTTFSLADERFAFAGKEVCQTTTTPDVNGLILSLGGVSPESFHPTVAGYKQEATDIENGVTYQPPYVNLRDSPLPGTPSTSTAIDLLGLLRTGPYNEAGWSANQRANFNKNSPVGTTATKQTWRTWQTNALGGCQTTQLVGIRDNSDPATKLALPPSAGDCGIGTYAALAGAKWNTAYDLNQVTVTATNTNTKLRPQADHVVPLKDAWSNGASGWTQGLRYDYGNDWRSIVLLIASATMNGTKQDSSIEEWQPPNTAYQCDYAKMWVAIKYDWNLQVDTSMLNASGQNELDYLKSELHSCP